MKIDTEIRHVTKPGLNLFLELGFTPDEAKRLQAASRKQINDTRLLKQQLMEELSVWIAKHHLKQAEAGLRASSRGHKKLCKTGFFLVVDFSHPDARLRVLEPDR